ncbi:hypothetical protein ACHAWU_007939 [Discostella pseudostelligera]|uniref:Uncharacterized protein n=1 Tax=Discostella pseudostelligera TaxID=259834 RepID=A0ABD3M5C3_9STRA
MQFSVGMLWLASALLLSPINAASSASFTTTIDHHQSSRRLLPIARNQLNFMNDVANPLQLANRNLRRADDPAIQALLQRARPYKQNLHRRKLDDVQFDGSYSLKFSQCLDVQTYNEDLFDQDILEYSSSGKVVSVKSYVLFYVCQTNVNCDYDADDVDLYLVDLQTYLSSAAKYRANIRVDYCEACDEFEDYCNPQQEEGDEEDANEDADAAAADEEEEVEEAAAEEEEDQPEQEDAEEEEPDGEQEENPEGEGEEGGRKLKEEQRKLAKQAISCDQCKAYECYAAENADDQVQSREELDEAVADWIDELVECKETGVYWNDMALYVSAMCTPYGDGVELAVFVDDECTMYTNQQSFYDVWDPSNDNENGVNYLTYAEEILKSSFSEVTACSEQQYGYPDGYAGDDADKDGDDEENEMNEYCQEILEGDNFVDFNNCGAADNDDAANAADDDGQYSWYKYDVKNADDINEVCAVLNKKEGAYTWSYDMESSGTWYERDSNGQIASKDSAATKDSNSITIAPAIIGVLVTICVFVVGGAAFLIMRRQKYAESSESVYSGGKMV